MDLVTDFLQGAELDGEAATFLTVVACVVGGLVVVAQRANSRRKAKEKIQRARDRRAESLQQAEEAVHRYKRTVRAARPDRSVHNSHLDMLHISEMSVN